MPEPEEDHVWIGDLSGFEVYATDDGDTLILQHRCGWERELPPADCYVGNIVVATREHPAACLVRTPAPDSVADRLRHRVPFRVCADCTTQFTCEESGEDRCP